MKLNDKIALGSLIATTLFSILTLFVTTLFGILTLVITICQLRK